VIRPPFPGSGIDPDKGDWACTSCGNWNWARRRECNKCGNPPKEVKDMLNMQVQAGPTSAGVEARKRKEILAAAMPSDGLIVPLAQGTSKPSALLGVHATKALPPSIDPGVGDWLCLCGNWNWAKRQKCNVCSMAKDSSNIGAKRTGEAGGFKEFDAEEDERRKMRAIEASQEKEMRKAEKKKCAYCKRFSCIC